MLFLTIMYVQYFASSRTVYNNQFCIRHFQTCFVAVEDRFRRLGNKYQKGILAKNIQNCDAECTQKLLNWANTIHHDSQYFTVVKKFGSKLFSSKSDKLENQFTKRKLRGQIYFLKICIPCSYTRMICLDTIVFLLPGKK